MKKFLLCVKQMTFLKTQQNVKMGGVVSVFNEK